MISQYINVPVFVATIFANAHFRVERLYPGATDFAKGEHALDFISGALTSIAAIGAADLHEHILQVMVTPYTGPDFYKHVVSVAKSANQVTPSKLVVQ